MNERENFLRTIGLNDPNRIPAIVSIPQIAIDQYGKEINKIIFEYRELFINNLRPNTPTIFEGLPPAYKIGEFIDSWGCKWENDLFGYEGQVVEHPLSDWNNFKKYKAPDPLNTRINEWGEDYWDWVKVKDAIKVKRGKDELIWGCGERLFDRLYFLRGFENLMIDFATGEPNLSKLIEVLFDYEYKLVKKWLSIGVDILWFHTDIGTQTNLMISPEMFRKYLKPYYKELFKLCRNSGVPVYLSSDGRIVDIIDDLIECGISSHDPQTGVITIEELEKYYKGKICIYLDIDRQKMPFFKPDYLKNMITEFISKLNTKKGGLILWAAICDSTTPLENIKVICETFAEYCL